MILVLAAVLGLWAAIGPEAILTLGDPTPWAELDAGHLKGRPARLAWSDDRSQLYLEVVDGATAEKLKFRHFIIRKGAAPKSIDSAPKWVDEYWKWKSAKRFFSDPVLTIDVDTQRQLQDNLNGTSTNKAAYLSDQPLTGTQLTLSHQPGETKIVNRLLLKGEIIGEFVDENIVPGYTFSWSPEELRLIAYRSHQGHLTIMNAEGHTQTVRSTKDVLLPAWSDDGAAIAYLERTSRKVFTIFVVEIQQQ